MKWLLKIIVAFFLFIIGASGFFLLVTHSALTAYDNLYLSLASSFLFIVTSILLLQHVLLQQEKNQELISAKKIVSNKLFEYESQFEAVFNYTNVGMILLGLDGKFIRINHALCQMLGYAEEEMLRMNFYYIIHSNDLNNLQVHIQALIDRKTNLYQSEQQCYKKNGELIWIMSVISLIRDEQEKPICFMIQVQNITEQKKAEERLRYMAYHDPLTSLANRNKLEQFVSHILAASRRHQQNFGILFLDIDRFKNINDTIGHESGDLLLQILAERLRNTVRNTDMVARLGGDEFVLLITDVKKSESLAIIAQKILNSIMEVVVIKGQELYITTSIGISIYPHDGQNMQSLMKNADLALYRAKEHGRNNYQFYTAEMTSRAIEKMALQNALGHALVKNEFVLHYQPKMDIKTRRISGVEAFLRWKNKEYGAITPDEIVTLAEETGLIIPVSEWILKTACQQLKIWHDMGYTSLTMAVNCSSRLFKQVTFIDEVLTTINQTGIPASALEIEVTEKMIMEDPENSLRVLYALKDLGVKIVIDDFGTGYWSLNNLRRLTIDKIKIDKTFIKQINVDEISCAIIIAIIAMVKKLNIISVAEGVETREQYDFLTAEGCEEIQGYYLTRPLSSENMTQFLQHPIPDAEAVKRNELS